MGRGLRRAVIGAALLSAALAGCGTMGDQLPEAVGGLPAGAPSRPAAPYAFPAVHDMPPERASPTLSEEDQVKLEKDLQATRDKTAREGAQDEPAPAGKKKPAPAKTTQKTGAKTGTNTGAKANP